MRQRPSTARVFGISSPCRAAAVLLCLALTLPAVGAELGEVISGIERRLAASPQSSAAGKGATARYLAGLVAASLDVHEQSRHLDRPYFSRSAGIDGRPGLYNPDTVYRSALLSDKGIYRLSGVRGSHAMLSLQILDAYPIVALGRNLAVIDLDAAGIRPGETFSITLGGESVPGRWYPLPAGARAVLARQTFDDWSREQPSTLRIERLDAGAATDPSVPGNTAADYLAAADAVWNSGLYARVPVNAFPPPRQSDTAAGGLGGQQSVMARYRLADDEALLITVRASNARYQGIQLGDPWFVTPNFAAHQSSLSRTQAVEDADGKLRFVIAMSDPGVANWLDPAGFAEGFVFLRWQGLTTAPDAADTPTIERVPIRELRSRLPAATRYLDPAERLEQLQARRVPPNRL